MMTLLRPKKSYSSGLSIIDGFFPFRISFQATRHRSFFLILHAGVSAMLKERIIKMLNLDSLLDNLSGFLETRLELFKLEAREEMAKILAKSLVSVLIALFLFFFIVFVSVGFAFWIGQGVGLVSGFMIVGGGYLLIMLALIAFRKPILDRLENVMHDLVKSSKEKFKGEEPPPPSNGQES
jgi:hypothetical protein